MADHAPLAARSGDGIVAFSADEKSTPSAARLHQQAAQTRELVCARRRIAGRTHRPVSGRHGEVYRGSFKALAHPLSTRRTAG